MRISSISSNSSDCVLLLKWTSRRPWKKNYAFSQHHYQRYLLKYFLFYFLSLINFFKLQHSDQCPHKSAIRSWQVFLSIVSNDSECPSSWIFVAQLTMPSVESRPLLFETSIIPKTRVFIFCHCSFDIYVQTYFLEFAFHIRFSFIASFSPLIIFCVHLVSHFISFFRMCLSSVVCF